MHECFLSEVKMEFRPCIDIHNGKVKQIVGGSLKDKGDCATENFVATHDAAYYAQLYRKAGVRGGHIIMLNAASSEYFEATKRADELAMQITKAFADKKIPFAVESFTNQQFVILTEQQKEMLAQKYYFEEDGDVQRFCTSWATTQAEVDALTADIAGL